MDNETKTFLNTLSKQLLDGLNDIKDRLGSIELFTLGDLKSGRLGAQSRLQTIELKLIEHSERMDDDLEKVEKLEDRVEVLEKAPAKAALSLWEKFINSLVAAGAGGIVAWFSIKFGGH